MKKLFSIFILFILWEVSFSQGRKHVINGGAPGLDSVSASVKISLSTLRALATVPSNKTYQTVNPGQEGIWYVDASDHTTPDNTGTCLRTVAGLAGPALKRVIQGNTIYDTWFGIVHDGVTDNKTAFKRLFSNCNGSTVIIGSGLAIMFDTLQLPALKNVKFIGASDSSVIRCTNHPGLFYFNDLTNVSFDNIFFQCTAVDPTLNFGDGLWYSIGKKTRNVRVDNCRYKMPFCNATAISFLVQVSGNGGQIDGIYFNNVELDSVGQSGIGILNRDTITVTQNGKDSCKNVHINNSHFKNMGLSGSFGFAVTFDGKGTACGYDGNDAWNMFGVAIENSGFDNTTFRNNTVGDFRAGRVVQPFGFSTRRMAHNIISGNQTIGIANGGISFKFLDSSVIENNTFFVSGANWVSYKDCNDLTINGDYYSSNYFYAIQVIADPNFTCKRNKFLNTNADNSRATTNFSTVNFSGFGASQNTFSGGRITKGTGGSLTGQQDSASNNAIFSVSVGTNNYHDGAIAITIPDANDTLSNDQDNIAYYYYRFNGTPTATRNIYFTNPAHNNFLVRNGTTQILNIVLMSTGSSKPVYPGQTIQIVHDGTNFQSVNAYASNYDGSPTGPLYIGPYRVWVDNNGIIRYSNTTPTSNQNGIPLTSSQVSADSVSQSAPGNLCSYTIVGTNGVCEVGGYVTVSSVVTDSLQMQVVYTDFTNVVSTVTMSPRIGTNGVYAFPAVQLRAKAGTGVTLKTVLTTSGGSITFNAGGTIKQIR